MNPIFDAGSGDAREAVRDPLTLVADLESTVPATEECRPIVGATVGADLESTVAATVAGKDYFTATLDGSVSKNRRFLLVEGDACIRETIRYYLAETGYVVAAFQNSRDALSALMADDFALLLYDPMAPGLRGDVFYDSVDRIDPELCARIVFMIGDHVDARTTKFIENINGFVLRKPFDSLDLLDAILTAETSGTLEGVFERASPAADTQAPDAAGESPLPGADAAGKRVPNELNAAALKNGPVLLIEPDPCFRETVRYYLAETGHPVVAIQNSRVALKEVLAEDFALILYDPTAPGLPADMFYQGIRRIDPELCERLVFLIGDRVDASTSAFLRKIDGFVLRKPFDAKLLPDKIAATEVLGSFRGAFESASTDPGLSQACLSHEDAPTAGTCRPQVTWFAETLSEPPAEAQPVLAAALDSAHTSRSTAPVRLSDVVPPLEPTFLPPRAFRVVAFAGLALLTVLLVSRWSKDRNARETAVASANHEAIEAEWKLTSRDLQAAAIAPPKTDAETRELAGIAGSRAVPQSSAAILTILAAAGEGIGFLEVHTRAHTEDHGIFEVRVRGVACGPEPRVMAEQFRQSAEASLKGIANVRLARVRIEQIEDVHGDFSDQKRVAFMMIATVGASEALVVIQKE